MEAKCNHTNSYIKETWWNDGVMLYDTIVCPECGKERDRAMCIREQEARNNGMQWDGVCSESVASK